MATETGRKAVINMRTTEYEKSLLKKAAEIAGFSNLTNFIMTAVRREANRILTDQHTTSVHAEDWLLINELIANPPEPNQKLRDLMKDE